MRKNKEIFKKETETKLTDKFKRIKKNKNSKSETIDKIKESDVAESTCAALNSDLSKSEIENIYNFLKEFDLNCDYGPFVGISRSDRLRRAERFNLPINLKVKLILENEKIIKKYPEFDLNIWHNYNTFI